MKRGELYKRLGIERGRMGGNLLLRYQRMKKARKLGTHTPHKWQKLKEEFDGRCVRCWKKSDRIEKDHIIPIYQGGSDHIRNIQPLCKSCNCAKGPETVNWKKARRLEIRHKS